MAFGLKRIWSYTAEYLTIKAVDDEVMCDLHAYWRAAAPEDEVPRQKDLHIAEMPDCRGNIALVDIEPEPFRARYLLVGSALVRLLGKDPTGLYVEDVYSKDIAEEALGAFRRVVGERQPLFYRREFQILGKSFGYKRLLLPLRLKSEEVRRVLLCIRPIDRKLERASQWRSYVEKLEAEEAAEARMATAWARSLGYGVGADEDVLELDESYEAREDSER